MSINKGLKRLWIVASVLWMIPIILVAVYADADFKSLPFLFYFGIGPLVIWWAFFWGISGFFGDEKKESDNNE